MATRHLKAPAVIELHFRFDGEARRVRRKITNSRCAARRATPGKLKERGATAPLGVTLAANGNIHVTAADITGRQGLDIAAGGNILIDGAQQSQTRQSEQWESGHGFARVRTDGRDHIVGANYNTADLNAANTVVTHIGSHLSGGSGNLGISGEGNVGILGSQLEAGQDMQLRAGQNLILGGGQSGTSESHFQEKGTFVGKMRDGAEQELTHRQVEASLLQAGGNIQLSAGGQLTLGAVDIASGGTTTLATPELIIQPEKTTDYRNQSEWDKDRGYTVQKGEGRVDETLVYAHIDARGGLVIPDTTRVQLHLDPGAAPAATEPSITPRFGKSQPSQHATPAPAAAVDPATKYRAIVDQLASQPGLGYLKDLAGRSDIDWQAIEAAHDQWDYKGKGLTKEGAIVLVAIVTYFTAGAASAAADAIVASTGASVAAGTAGAAASAALAAGMVTVASQVAVSTANNSGQLDKVFKDVTSEDSIKQVIAAMITAGLLNAPAFGESGQSLNQIASVSTTPGIGSIGTFNWNTFGQNLAGMAGRSLVSTAVENALNGGDFEQTLRNNFVSDLAAVGANGIGSQWGSGQNPLLQTAAHGLLGCAAAEAKGGDCQAGAVGGMTESVLGNVIDQFGTVSTSPLGKGLYTGAALLTSSIVADELDLDTVTAMGAAQNAAANNYLNHRKPNAARMSEKEQYEAAVAACADGDQNACTLKNQLATLSAQRDAELAKACDGSNPQLCNSLARQASTMGNRVTGRQGELVYANSPEQGAIRYLNVATIGPVPERSAYSDSFHYQASRSTSEALPAGALLAAPEAIAVAGVTKPAVGALLGGGFDALGQLYQGGEYRFGQTVVAATTGAIAFPLGSSSTAGNAFLGGSVGAINTSLTNYYYQENKDVFYAGFNGMLFGGFGTGFGQGIKYVGQKYWPTLGGDVIDSSIPILLQNYGKPNPYPAYASFGIEQLLSNIPSFIATPDNAKAKSQ